MIKIWEYLWECRGEGSGLSLGQTGRLRGRFGEMTEPKGLGHIPLGFLWDKEMWECWAGRELG